MTGQVFACALPHKGCMPLPFSARSETKSTKARNKPSVYPGLLEWNTLSQKPLLHSCQEPVMHSPSMGWLSTEHEMVAGQINSKKDLPQKYPRIFSTGWKNHTSQEICGIFEISRSLTFQNPLILLVFFPCWLLVACLPRRCKPSFISICLACSVLFHSTSRI